MDKINISGRIDRDFRPIRSGCWVHKFQYCHSSYNATDLPRLQLANLGFRIVL